MSGRVVLVTGAAQGLGKGIAKAFAQLGDIVVVADKDQDGARKAAQELDGLAAPLDVTRPASIRQVVDAVLGDHGRIDVLVNNAGIVGGAGPIADIDLSLLDAAYAVNVRGTVMMMQAVAKPMQAAESGVIINIGSIGARQPTPGLGHYEATKAAVDAITRSAAIELAGHGIRVNAVSPGPVLTPLTADMVANTEARSAWERRIPLGMIAAVSQVAPAVVFLASTAASHITGVSLAVDGGQLLT